MDTTREGEKVRKRDIEKGQEKKEIMKKKKEKNKIAMVGAKKIKIKIDRQLVLKIYEL